MDQKGYKAYLQSLGNQQHYIGRIQDLLDLEKELNINLDDYVPYNGDYGKVDELNSVLPNEKLYDERLFFSINSYMRYRLSDFVSNNGIKDNIDKEPISEYFTFNGTESELKSKLLTFMSETDSQTFINGIKDFIQCLEKDEFVEQTISFPESNSENDSRMMSLLIKSSNYNINIKALSLITIALLLDIKLTLGFASAALAVIGFNSQAIVRVNVSEGERCLILEAIQSKNRIINEDVFSMCNFECVHNDWDCKYQDDDKCTISKENIKTVLDRLCDKNIFKKIGSFYKYNF